MSNARRALDRVARRIAAPTNYYSGVQSPGLLRPANVLLFHRTNLAGPGAAHHHRFVLILNLKERGEAVIDDVFFRLDPGHALLICPYQFHGYHFARPKAPISWLFVTFETDRGDELAALRNRAVKLTARALEVARQLAAAYVSVAPAASRANRVLLLTALLLNDLLETAEKTPHLPSVRHPSGPQEWLVRVSRFVHARMQEGIGIKDIARHVAVSTSHLRLLFRQRMGMSLGHYLRHKRMLRAASLLDTSDMRLREVAARCGFASEYSLSRAFKHETGLSPRAYRRRRGR